MTSVRLADQVAQSLRRAGICRSDALVVGLSGGGDSLVLTHVLARLYRACAGPRPLAVHVDHRLRPESAADARRVSALAEAMGVSLEVVAVDVEAWQATQRQGVEAAARAARYAALAAAAQRHQADCIAVAHTRDDQAETVLLRLARGSSLDGLAGMRECSRRAIPIEPTGGAAVTCRIVRPLLQVARSSVRQYLAEHGLSPVDDPSNQSLQFRRNALRHELLPLVERISPGASHAIARTARLLADDADLLLSLTCEAYAQTTESLDGVARVDRVRFRALHPALQRRVLAHVLVQVAGDHAPLSENRIEALRQATLVPSGSRLIEIGQGIVGLVDYARVFVGPVGRVASALAVSSGLPQARHALEMPLAGDQRVRLSGGASLLLNAPASSGEWAIRTRRNGDRLRLPSGELVRLQDWLVNHKVPALLRDRLPLLAQGDVVRWIAGAMGEAFTDPAAGVSAWVVRHEHEHEEEETEA